MKAILSAVAVLALLAASPALAGSATTNVTVKATVAPTCTISSPDQTIDLNTYNPASASSASATVNFTCTRTTPVTGYAFSNGANFDGTNRRMKGALASPDFLAYSIATGTANIVDGGASSVPVTVNVAAGQWVQPDSYTDTVVLTLNW